MLDIRDIRRHLLAGQVIPAHPLALTPSRRLDERRQRALTRYYLDAGAGGIAVGVHTTQFEIREPAHDLLRPVLELAAGTVAGELSRAPRPFVRVAGIVGDTAQAAREADLARSFGYDIGLLRLAESDVAGPGNARLLEHCREIASIIPLFGFYLQPAVGGRTLDHDFWRGFSDIPDVCAIKIAPFDRYRTMDVVRAIAESGREDIALYTGNDDNIVLDLLTPFPCVVRGRLVERRMLGGLLGQWAVGTRRAVAMLDEIRARRTAMGDSSARWARQSAVALSAEWLRRAAALTDFNGAIFDARHGFAGCIPGIHEVLRRQELLAGTWCLDPALALSPGQSEEIDRVLLSYPDLTDAEFIAQNRDTWLR
ncbi:MAG: dihydrodipicolinate synthase family protein [Gemmatimonadaceae bacterium]